MLSQFDLKPSKLLGGLLTINHLLALVSLMVSPIFLELKGGLIFWCIYSWFFSFNKYVLLQHKTSVVKLVADNESFWRLQNRSEENLGLGRLKYYYISNYLIILKIVPAINSQVKNICWRKILDVLTPTFPYIIIAKDSLDQDGFRKLSVLLRTASKK